MRQERSYSDQLMTIGKENEEKVINYLIDECNVRNTSYYKDVREDKEFQNNEIDLIIKGSGFEIKGDKHINSKGNLFFETFRINHYSEDHPTSQGWGYKSKADFLIIRNWETGETFTFDFKELRQRVGILVSDYSGNRLQTTVVETDKVKTTWGLLIPMRHLRDLYDYYKIL